jgi:hypothetical protein
LPPIVRPRGAAATRTSRQASRRPRESAVDLELAERRPGADRRPVDALRDGAAQLDERLGRDDAVAQERHQLGAAAERDGPVPERGDGSRRPIQAW